MKHRALPIKKWIIRELSASGWSSIISSSLPALTKHNSNFNCFNIDRRTLWDQTEVKIIQHYLYTTYNRNIPEEILNERAFPFWFRMKK